MKENFGFGVGALSVRLANPIPPKLETNVHVSAGARCLLGLKGDSSGRSAGTFGVPVLSWLETCPCASEDTPALHSPEVQQVPVRFWLILTQKQKTFAGT